MNAAQNRRFPECPSHFPHLRGRAVVYLAPMKIHPFHAYYPDFQRIPSPDAFFDTVKYKFAEYLRKGYFHAAPEACFYICEIHTADTVHTGFLASVDIEEYLQGNILRHEDTLTTTEENLSDLLTKRKAMIKPVLLTYKPSQKLKKLLREGCSAEPFYSVYFEKEKQEHVYYRIDDPKFIARITKAWKKDIHKAYIADGHHRCSINAKLYRSMKKTDTSEAYRYLLCAFFPFDQLVIHEYNRIVDMQGGISPPHFMALLSQLCDITPIAQPERPRRKHELTLYLGHEWYRLRWKEHILKKYARNLVITDAAILNKEVLRRIVGITDVRSDARLTYVDGISGIEALAEKTRKGSYRVGFCLFPLPIRDLVTVADAGETLPPKSTWFEPRVKNGLISQSV